MILNLTEAEAFELYAFLEGALYAAPDSIEGENEIGRVIEKLNKIVFTPNTASRPTAPSAPVGGEDCSIQARRLMPNG